MAIDWGMVYERAELLNIVPSDSDFDLTALISRIWDMVRRRRVLYKWATITTVEDQAAYDIPSTDIDGNSMNNPKVYEVFWSPAGETLFDYDNSTVWDYMRNAEIKSVIDRFVGGSWQVIDGKIYLEPTPTEDDEIVPILMTVEKTDDDITDADKEAVMHGVLWVLYERAVTSLAKGGSFRAGSYAATPNPSTINYLESRANYHRDQFNLMLSASDDIVTL